MITLLVREGDCFNQFSYKAFSKAAVLAPLDLTPETCVRDEGDEDDATEVSVEHLTGNVSIITYSDSEGNCTNWIGPTDQYVE